ncbi:hypothetical protein TWF506_002774 [Arthrobotrys conoides]|uniref:Endo-1,5-alpha-L-arabinanase A n=1 Tax=Arthrobotrys conoides TaxID=74498 RepID=A0AAN8RK88_9PEZI
MLLKVAVAFLVSSTRLASGAYANPGACSGDCGTHDPAVIRRTSDGKFYRFSTNNFISIASASSIAGPWTYLGQALPGGSKISGFSGVDLWAPDIIYNNGVYYLYYSVSSFGTQNSAIGVATSSTMDPGSWVDRGTAGVSSKTGSAYNAIDSNIIKVGSDFYMAFGSFWGDIYQVKMDSGLLKTAGTSSYQIAWTSFGNGAMEGAFTYYRSGYYYLFTSWGNCCQLVPRPAAGTEYHMRVCRSTSATGGFKDKSGVDCKSSGGTTILESHDYVYAPGHGGVIDVPGVGSLITIKEQIKRQLTLGGMFWTGRVTGPSSVQALAHQQLQLQPREQLKLQQQRLGAETVHLCMDNVGVKVLQVQNAALQELANIAMIGTRNVSREPLPPAMM